MESSSGRVRQENGSNRNEQRKSANMPTLMITVKNEMAQAIHKKTVSKAGKNEMKQSM